MLDKLDEIFELQKKFNESLGNKIPVFLADIFSANNNSILKNQFLAIFDEVAEALREIPWKPWKLMDYRFTLTPFRLELIDVFHFLVNLFIFSGTDTKLVLDLFKMKNKENIRRQEVKKKTYGY